MSGNAQIIESSTLVDLSYHSIRKDITEEYLPAGKKISLCDLCERYGVSTTPIKQALNRLITEGLVESIPRKGWRVKPFSWSDIDELFELRLMMELNFASQAIASVKTSAALQIKFEQNLQENLALVQRYDTAEEYFRTYELEQQFHELFILSSGNSSALRIYKGLNSHSYAAYLFGKQPRPQTINGILEHQAVYQAMKDGDVEAVRSLLESHIENARKKLRLFLKLQQNIRL